MAKGFWYPLFVILSLFTAAHALPSSGSNPLDFSSNPLFAEIQGTNATTTTYNTTAVSSDHGIIHCDGSKYRSSLQKASCQDAILQIPQTQSSVRFHVNGASLPSDLRLPQRFIGKDGLCIVEVVLKDEARYGSAKWSEIAKAAVDMYFGCVVPKGEGSVAMDIGKDQTLGLIMTSYTPRVTCLSVRDVPTIANCKTILNKMYTSPIPRVFGFPGKVKPDVPLSKLLSEGEFGALPFSISLAVLPVNSPFLWPPLPAPVPTRHTPNPQAREDWSSWYEIWEAAQALVGMCVRYGKTGYATR
ncbi:MAG: hypothetical protein LQ352_007471, partial [Teloschistes flavicans]